MTIVSATSKEWAEAEAWRIALAGQQKSWQVVLMSPQFWRVAAAAILVTLCVISLIVYVERFHAGRVGAVIFCIPAMACLLLALGANGALALTGLALAIGIALGAELDLMAYLCSRYFKPVH